MQGVIMILPPGARCIVPEDQILVGGTRICYCHGNVAMGAYGGQTNEGCHYGADCMGDCRQFGNNWFRNFESGVHAGVDFEFLLR